MRKAPLVVYMIERRVGEDSFRKLINAFVTPSADEVDGGASPGLSLAPLSSSSSSVRYVVWPNCEYEATEAAVVSDLGQAEPILERCLSAIA